MGMLAAGLAGCSGYPRDPDDTLTRILREGVVRIGVAPAEPWTLVGDAALDGAETVAEADGVPLAGIEVALAAAFAEHLEVQPQWVVDGENGLVERVELGQLDLVVAGLTSDTPWSKKIGVTRGYAQALDGHGKKKKHVMGVPLGENAFLSELERFLDSRPDSEKGGI
ncbi:Uncharacterised protein [Mycobacteroides abscessus subsp. abscessus]|nr:Uncharacterised protein [Mycobacteroides abscessus subsp. abscessus]